MSDRSAPRTRPRADGALATLALTAITFALGACVERVSAERRGAELFVSPSLSSSRFNQYACATCHRARASDRPDAILPGALLAGATRRPSFWGGSITALEDAVGLCFEKFMRGGRFDPSTPDAIALYAYLDALSSSPDAVTTAIPVTIPIATQPPGPGDPARGARLYDRACAYCHGPPRRMAPPPITAASALPEDTEAEHTRAQGYTEETLRQVFIEKSRHGSFLGLAGVMPPFSTETLSDGDLADITAWLAPALR
jgi:mono/diheme cytochrome c family protein